MKHTVALAAAVFAVACAGSPPGQSSNSGPAAGITGADSSAIVALNGRLKAAALAANWDAWGAEYTSDPVRYPPNLTALVGKSAVDAWYHGTPKFTAFEVAVTSVMGRADLAVATGSFKATAPAGKARAVTTDEGKFMQLLMKQPDGSWKIARDIWNSDLPLSGATKK